MKPTTILRVVITTVCIACHGATSSPDAGSDASVAEGGLDVASDVPIGFGDAIADVADEDVADAGPLYSALNDKSKWSTFDMHGVDGGLYYYGNAFIGGAFDGRYVYFMPPNIGFHAVATRYDTLAAFASAPSWSTFDVTSLDPGALGFAGGAFDGRYVYLAGYAYSGRVVARYDSLGSFTTSAGWSSFNVLSLDAGTGLGPYNGAVYDGHYVYLVPVSDGIVTRVDTSDFTDAGAWSMFDTTSVNANATIFSGGLFDGRYVYFVPNHNGTSGVVTRYDTTAPFDVGGSWSTFDVGSVNSSAMGFVGGVFDGRYAYFVPYSGQGGYDGVVARFDTQAPFTAAGSWSTFDTKTLSPKLVGFQGGAFDGRYVYFIPFINSGATADGMVARVDTQAPFGSASSWSSFDVTSVNQGAVGYVGAVFDGRYLYLVPCNSTIAARFDAKSPPSLPPGYAHGSFF